MLADRENLLPGGKFEEAKGGKLAGWDFLDGPGVSIIQDTADEARRRGVGPHAGFPQGQRGRQLPPLQEGQPRAVAASITCRVWIKTKDAAPAGDIRVAVLAAGGRSLNFTNLGVKATQDWTEHHIVFNSMEFAEAQVYIGIWGGRGGTIWMDDADPAAVRRRQPPQARGVPRARHQRGRQDRVRRRARTSSSGSTPRWAACRGRGSTRSTTPSRRSAWPRGRGCSDGQRLQVSYYHTVVIYDEPGLGVPEER